MSAIPESARHWQREQFGASKEEGEVQEEEDVAVITQFPDWESSARHLKVVN